MGQQSILHAVKTRSLPVSKRSLNVPSNSSIAEENEESDISKPLAKQLSDLEFADSSSSHAHNIDKGRFYRIDQVQMKKEQQILKFCKFPLDFKMNRW